MCRICFLKQILDSICVMLTSPVDPCTHVDVTYFGPYILPSMFLYTGSLKLINNYEDKFIVLQSRICVEDRQRQFDKSVVDPKFKHQFPSLRPKV